MTPATDEKHLQQNAIDLLTRMGYTYISPEEMARYRDSDAQVVLRDVLRERLAALNSYEYKDETRRFDEGRLSEEEKLKEARKVQEEFLRGETQTQNDRYPEALRGKSRALALYDNLEEPLQRAAQADGAIAVADVPLAYGEKREGDLLSQTALRIDEVFREASKKPEWQTNHDVHNRIEERIDDILWELERNYSMKFDDIETLLKELVQIGVRHDG